MVGTHPAFSPAGRIVGVTRSAYERDCRWYVGGDVGRIRYFMVPRSNGILATPNIFWPWEQEGKDWTNETGTGEISSDVPQWRNGRDVKPTRRLYPVTGTNADYRGLSPVPLVVPRRCADRPAADVLPGLGVSFRVGRVDIRTRTKKTRIEFKFRLRSEGSGRPLRTNGGPLRVGLSATGSGFPLQSGFGLCFGFSSDVSTGISNACASFVAAPLPSMMNLTFAHSPGTLYFEDCTVTYDPVFGNWYGVSWLNVDPGHSSGFQMQLLCQTTYWELRAVNGLSIISWTSAINPGSNPWILSIAAAPGFDYQATATVDFP